MRLMAKNEPARHGHGVGGRFLDQKQESPRPKEIGRKILFPTEATTIDRKKIDRAIARVISKKK